MLKSLTYISAAVVILIACDSSAGIGSLGSDFNRAFMQDRNAEPLDASELTLNLTPRAEPFNP